MPCPYCTRCRGAQLESLEWLEEWYPEQALLPHDAAQRALVRAMAAAIGCDIHPLDDLRVQNPPRTRFAAGDAAMRSWIDAAFEILITRHGHGGQE